MNTLKKTVLGLGSLFCLGAAAGYAGSMGDINQARKSEFMVQAGGYWASQGTEQFVPINGLIGDDFTLNSSNSSSYLVGLGYYMNGYENNQFRLMYGLNAYYLAKTTVEGLVIQEQIFTNLAYQYSVINWPVYVAAKALIPTRSDKWNLSLDLGIGPNFIQSSNFYETSLDGGFTLPDNAFSGQTSAAFSATAGIGFRFNNLLEVGYRFFYLGQGQLLTINSQILNNLNTGNSYANAVVATLVF